MWYQILKGETRFLATILFKRREEVKDGENWKCIVIQTIFALETTAMHM